MSSNELKLHKIRQKNDVATPKRLLNLIPVIRSQPAKLDHKQPKPEHRILIRPEVTVPKLLKQQSPQRVNEPDLQVYFLA